MADQISENKKKAEFLLRSDFLTKPTKKALTGRLDKIGENVFFSDDNYFLLNIVCDLLMDQNSQERSCIIALSIDERLAGKKVDGWRYDALPPDDEKYHLGLKGINETSAIKFNTTFIKLNKDQQTEILSEIQTGKAEGEGWKKLNSKLFFEDLLAETAEIYYSHPIVQSSLNYVGMADAKGWKKIKLNEFEEPESH